MTYSSDFRYKVLSVREAEGLTIARVAARFGVSEKGIGHALRRMGVNYKKTLNHPRRCEGARRVFQTLITWHTGNKRTIVYIDESGFAPDMPRTHGYAPVGAGVLERKTSMPKGAPMLLGP